ncbi:MAG: bile acid:sodium symporter family protein [Deltaproteobacteria bacterium]|nr:bile acid:sodium symporter family protein [Deltaproteobacteria bacterium]
MRVLDTITKLFPLWVLLAGALALAHPPLFAWFSGSMIVWGLAVIMLGMGITLSIDDFRAVATVPGTVVAGVAAQYLIMPVFGWASAHITALPPALAVGVILVGCCPGGTASNVVCYLARANVALSVVMTTCSTFAAVIMTPLLTKWLAGTLVPVDAWGLFVSTSEVVLLPVVAGLALHHVAPRLVRRVLPAAPLVSVIAIVLICASIIAQSAGVLLASGGRLIAAVLLLHSGGFGVGYAFGRVLGYDAVISRTISIEVGMQNSGLGAVLARQHFSDPLTALPAAISATFHSVIGSALAAYWRSREERRGAPASS